MHDPMVVAFEIRRPWPTRRPRRVREGSPRWELKVYRKHGSDHVGWNPRRWWNPRCWSPFQVAFGRQWYFPSLITVWHVEPKGHDSGTICKHSRRWQDPDGTWQYQSLSRWRWHFWHWHIQVALLGKMKRSLFERCIECGRRYPWGYAPVSHQWDGPGARWFRVQRLNYHHECSSLVSARHTISLDERLIGTLFAAYRTLSDLTEPEALARLTDPKMRSMEFGDAYRLTRILGYERNDDYDLVRTKDRPVDSGKEQQ